LYIIAELEGVGVVRDKELKLEDEGRSIPDGHNNFEWQQKRTGMGTHPKVRDSHR
jgi:hypothetical protein